MFVPLLRNPRIFALRVNVHTHTHSLIQPANELMWERRKGYRYFKYLLSPRDNDVKRGAVIWDGQPRDDGVKRQIEASCRVAFPCISKGSVSSPHT